MGTLTQLLIAILGVSAVVTLLAVAVVVVRVARLRAGRRRARLAGPLRPVLLALAAHEDPAPDGVPEARTERDLARLAGADRRMWRAVEPSLLALVAKVRGSSRELLVEVLRRRGAYEESLRLTGSRRALRRATGADRLGLLGDPSAQPAVIRLLADPDANVRRVATRAAGRLPSEAAARAVLETLDGPRPVPARVVTQALLRMGQPAVAALIGKAADGPPAAAATAVEVLGQLRSVAASPVLLSALKSGAPEVRIRAARALGRIGAPAAVGPLMEATGPDRPREMRVVALGALGAIGDGRRAADMAELLGDPDPGVARAAGRALGALGPAGEESLRRVAAAGGPAARHAEEALGSVEMARHRSAPRGRVS